MKKVIKTSVAMFTAAIIFILSITPFSAQSLPESVQKTSDIKSNLSKIETMIALTAEEEKETKMAILQDNITVSNQTNVLKLALKQYIERYKDNENSTACVNDEWIVTQSVGEKTPTLMNGIWQQDVVTTGFLVLDENGNKITPSDAAQDPYVVLKPIEKSSGLGEYMIFGKVKYYATAEVLWPFPTIYRIQINKVQTSTSSGNPNNVKVTSFVQYAYAGNTIEDFYMKEKTINNPVNYQVYTLYTSDMGFYKFQGGIGGEVIVGTLFYTNGPKDFEIYIRMNEIYHDT